MSVRASAGLAVAIAAVALTPAQAARDANRTTLVSGPVGGGASSAPSISPAGRLVAFQSFSSQLAPDPNGPVEDVFLHDRTTGATTLVSTAPDGGPADGPSEAPVIAGEGLVVFASEATNLVPGDGNGAKDIFARSGSGAIVRVSVAHDGREANGASYEPDVSRDGRVVVFTSRADNLVPFDVNGVEDVFVRDLETGTTKLVSEAGGASAPGRSRAPAVSPDGGWVSFESTASTFVPKDTNGVADVFLADLAGGTIRRVSVSNGERQQNRSVVQPFVQVSDVSEGGRFVVFDSDATNLVREDSNRDTDVFVRDVRRDRTERVSVSLLGRQGDNDSYIPSITADGRYVGFSSFAGNLWTFDRAGEDVFVHDRRTRLTVLMSVTAGGRRRPRGQLPQLLRRPALADGARSVAFSTTSELVTGDRDGLEDVVVRNTAPPAGRIVVGPSGRERRRPIRLTLGADDPAARVFVCSLNDSVRVRCPRRSALAPLRRGRYRLIVRAGGPGMIFDPTPAVRRFRVR